MALLTGTVWMFGDNISTEYMMPGHVMLARLPDAEAKMHCMAAIRPEFARAVKQGDIIVAGENFGCGSSRLGARLLLALGLSAVVAESFAGTFFRNGINAGLPLIEIEGIRSSFDEGDSYSIDVQSGQLKNASRDVTVHFPSFSPEIVRILDFGGIIPLLKHELSSERKSG